MLAEMEEKCNELKDSRMQFWAKITKVESYSLLNAIGSLRVVRQQTHEQQKAESSSVSRSGSESECPASTFLIQNDINLKDATKIERPWRITCEGVHLLVEQLELIEFERMSRAVSHLLKTDDADTIQEVEPVRILNCFTIFGDEIERAELLLDEQMLSQVYLRWLQTPPEDVVQLGFRREETSPTVVLSTFEGPLLLESIVATAGKAWNNRLIAVRWFSYQLLLLNLTLNLV